MIYDVAVFGAGVVGSMIARELSRYELSAVVLEKESDVARGASRANSGILHAGFDAEPGSWKALLNVRGRERMDTVTKELGVSMKKNGALVVVYRGEEEESLHRLYEKGQKNGVKDLHLIGAAELRRLEENIADNAQAALWAPGSAIVLPYELTIAAIGNAMDNGMQLKLEFGVKSMARNGGVWEISSETETVRARYVVNAAGVFSDEIAAMAGVKSIRITPRRGEYLILSKDCGGLVRHTLFKPSTKMGKGILVSPTADGNLLLGPTSEDIPDKEDRATTREGLERVIRSTSAYVKGLDVKKVIASFCGVRAVGNTGDFILGITEDGFANAAGIESPGLTASPAIAEHIVSLLGQKGLQLAKKKDFCPYRKPMHAFSSLPAEERTRRIRENASYGRIVCRCEEITEGEILDAIRNNPKALTLDAIKSRTRAMTGRCQGGFCMPYLTEILSRELGIPMDQVTLRGAGTHILSGKLWKEGEE